MDTCLRIQPHEPAQLGAPLASLLSQLLRQPSPGTDLSGDDFSP